MAYKDNSFPKVERYEEGPTKVAVAAVKEQPEQTIGAFKDRSATE